MTGLAGMAAVAATCLIIVSSRLDSEATGLGAAADAIRNAQQLEIMLLDHARIVGQPPTALDRDAAAERGRVESTLARLFREAAAMAGGPQERILIGAANAAVSRYLAGLGQPLTRERLQAARDRLNDLVSFNFAEAAQAKADAARWNQAADVVALVVAILLVLVTVATLAWLHASVFSPLFRLRTAIDAFGTDPAQRVRDGGSSEVRAIAQAFNHMADRLDQQRQRQLTFIAAVVHDLRNPMGPLRIAADSLATGQSAGRSEQLGAMIVRQVTRLERLTTDLLDAARIEAGELALRRERCDLRDCVLPVVELFRAQPDGERVSAHVPREPIVLDADVMRLQQVVGNLVSNALKYSPEGGDVEIMLAADRECGILQVTDQGLGIDAAELPHIFEPFRRAARSAMAIPGVGLGLSISRRIIAAHGGRIDVRSAVGLGSTFTVRVPRVAAALDHETSENTSENAQASL